MNLKTLLLTLAAASHIGFSSAQEIDRLVDIGLSKVGITASHVCSDATFLRRTFQVTTSSLPSAEQVRAFLADTSADKRSRIIDSLVGSPLWVDNMVLKWGDLLRIKSEFPSCMWPNGVQAYNRWLTVRLRDNCPYDRMVRELVVCTGSDFRDAAVNFYRAHVTRTPAAYCNDIALIFMGMRQAPEEWQPFFSQLYYKTSKEWKEEFLCLNLQTDAPQRPIRLSGNTSVRLRKGEDFRVPFAEWLTGKDNPQFARAITNRVWSWLMGRGIVDEADDFRLDNPPSNPELLDFLATDFAAHGYDIQRLFQQILRSDCYQRSCISTADNAADHTLFSHYTVRRITAEELSDAVCDITGAYDIFSSRAPEPFTKYPQGTRSTQIGDGTVTTSQLELFGRPSRDVSLESARSNSYNSKQVLYLLNSQNILEKIKHNRTLTSLMYDRATTREQLIDHLYLTIMSRHATASELAALRAATDHSHVTDMCQDITWALINSDEFLFIH